MVAVLRRPQHPGDTLRVFADAARCPRSRESCIELPQYGVDMLGRAEELPIIEVLDVEELDSEGGQPLGHAPDRIGDAETAVDRAERIALLGAAIHAKHCARWKRDGRRGCVAPRCPRHQAWVVPRDCFANGRPFQRGKRSFQVDVDNGDALRPLSEHPLGDGAEVHQYIGAPWHGHSELARAQEQRLQRLIACAPSASR